MSVSCIPNALVLFNPVIDNSPGGYGYDRIGDAYKSFSPLHNIKNGTPPTILFLGTNDNLIPVETAKYYQKVMEKVKSSCELHLYEGQGHGFFNYRNLSLLRKVIVHKFSRIYTNFHECISLNINQLIIISFARITENIVFGVDSNFEYYKKTVSEADEFLQSLGYLNNKPIIEIE